MMDAHSRLFVFAVVLAVLLICASKFAVDAIAERDSLRRALHHCIEIPETN